MLHRRRGDPLRYGRRHLYRLTEKGIDLAPALVEIVLWSARYEETDAPEEVIGEMRSHRERFLAAVRAAWLADPS